MKQSIDDVRAKERPCAERQHLKSAFGQIFRHFLPRFLNIFHFALNKRLKKLHPQWASKAPVGQHFVANTADQFLLRLLNENGKLDGWMLFFFYILVIYFLLEKPSMFINLCHEISYFLIFWSCFSLLAWGRKKHFKKIGKQTEKPFIIHGKAIASCEHSSGVCGKKVGGSLSKRITALSCEKQIAGR